MPVIARIEVAGPAEEQPLGPRDGLDLRWLHRTAGPGLLERAVREVELPPGDGYVWIAGEATGLVAVRRHLRRERGLPAHRVHVDGYWRRGTADHDHHAPVEED